MQYLDFSPRDHIDAVVVVTLTEQVLSPLELDGFHVLSCAAGDGIGCVWVGNVCDRVGMRMRVEKGGGMDKSKISTD